MPPTLSAPSAPHRSEQAELSFTRTVDRRILHRWALSEVFLTDVHHTDDGGYRAAAQLPWKHPYYGDHLTRLDCPDPLLLLECVRQAETWGGHAVAGVGEDRQFLLRRWTMALPGLLTAPDTQRPAEVSVAVTTSGAQGPAGSPRRLTFAADVGVWDHHVGRVRIEVGYIPSDVYAAVRESGRGRPLPDFDALPRTTSSLAPHWVGRTDRHNVVLDDITVDGQGTSARVCAPLDNRSMFDHAQDHVPGMVLMEAARQLCLFTGAELHGTSAAHTTVAGFDFSFSRYAELDAPLTAHVRHSGPYAEDDALASALPRLTTHHVEFLQDGALCARGVLHTTTARAAPQRSQP
ncbi:MULTISPECIES: AfsA-related hotdog domain-containing protein [unclassified Streptomyces]|uniref:AfsA-related hotdog domain-containing protein n=1 Tax=unclassified Streptomyces TaxID=2593676 RepID=UPI002E1792C4